MLKDLRDELRSANPDTKVIVAVGVIVLATLLVVIVLSCLTPSAEAPAKQVVPAMSPVDK